MDFVTIVFSNKIEVNLLKLQAYSFTFVEPSLIQNIFVLFNDSKYLNHDFTAMFHEVIEYYPEQLRKKIKLLFLKDLNLEFTHSDWFTQQLVKLVISNLIQTKYYVVLDAKNHFIKNITKDLFFNQDDRPYMYYNDCGGAFNTYYNNCLDYFNVTCPNQHTELGTLKVQTTTPFVFITDECIQLIHEVEKRENKSFHDFFTESKKYTEFYFYYSYLIHHNQHLQYEHVRTHQPVVTVGSENPETAYYNTWWYKKHILNTENICVFSLHRNSLSILDKDYKKALIEFYTTVYHDEDMLKKVLYFLQV